MLAQPPEALGGQQWVTYEIRANGKTLAKGESGMWILGAVDIDVPVSAGEELNDRDHQRRRQAGAFPGQCALRHCGRQGNAAGEIARGGKYLVADPNPAEDYQGGPIRIAGAPYATAIPAQPLDKKKPAILRIPAARPGERAIQGDARRRLSRLAMKASAEKSSPAASRAPERAFSPSSNHTRINPMVKSAIATGPNSLRVELADGRTQDIAIQNLEGSGQDIAVEITETKNGQILRSENTKQNQ